MPRPTMCILQKHIQTGHIQMHIIVAARGPEERSKGGVGAGVALRGLMIIMCLELSGERVAGRCSLGILEETGFEAETCHYFKLFSL